MSYMHKNVCTAILSMWGQDVLSYMHKNMCTAILSMWGQDVRHICTEICTLQSL